jgi:hypothetical protein
MASISRNEHDAVVISGAVFRALLDLALDAPVVDGDTADWLAGAYEVKGIGLDLLDPSVRTRVEAALVYAVDRAMRGERSARSGEAEAEGEILVQGAEKVHAFLDAP